jgi:hypothetical protein
MCPSCKIVFLQWNEHSTADNIEWFSRQPYIDLTSHSYYDAFINGALKEPGEKQRIGSVALRQPVFAAGGNGLAGFLGFVGEPSNLEVPAGAPNVIVVGAHDNGMVTLWSATMPNVVADGNKDPAANWSSMTRVDPTGGSGTSSATPYAAGTFARMLLEARDLVHDAGTGNRNGDLVVAGPHAHLPSSGPLASGTLTVRTAEIVFFHTAKSRPVKDTNDGEACDVTSADLTCILYPTLPAQWSTLPEPIPAYYFVGYGQVGNVTLPHALHVLDGTEPMPDRSTEDSIWALDQEARSHES